MRAGRVDMMVRGVVDGCGLYDIVQGGIARELWLEIVSVYDRMHIYIHKYIHTFILTCMHAYIRMQ
jgi:hypothetical protein